MTVFLRTTAYMVMGVFLATGFASAYVASSTNYRIQSDSINIGGILSTSTNYKIEDTLGEIATGVSTSTSYKIKAGYQQMQEGYLSISSPSDITMTNLTITQDTAVGSSTWKVTTDNAAGYTLSVKASVSPALSDSGTGESFTDYTEVSPGVKETWLVTNAYEFGWSAYGDNVSGYGSDTDCVDTVNVPSAALLWEGFSTSNIEMASSSSATPSGKDSTLCAATEQDTVFAPSGTYTAIVTVTAVTQ